MGLPSEYKTAAVEAASNAVANPGRVTEPDVSRQTSPLEKACSALESVCGCRRGDETVRITSLSQALALRSTLADLRDQYPEIQITLTPLPGAAKFPALAAEVTLSYGYEQAKYEVRSSFL